MIFATHVTFNTVKHAMLQIPASNVIKHLMLLELLVHVHLALLFIIPHVFNVMLQTAQSVPKPTYVTLVILNTQKQMENVLHVVLEVVNNVKHLISVKLVSTMSKLVL